MGYIAGLVNGNWVFATNSEIHISVQPNNVVDLCYFKLLKLEIIKDQCINYKDKLSKAEYIQ